MNFSNAAMICLLLWVTGYVILAVGLIILGFGIHFKNKIMMYIGIFLMAVATMVLLGIGMGVKL